MKKFAIFLFVMLVTFAVCSKPLPQKLVNKIKDATVFITTGNGSGSGFLFKKTKAFGYIATNAHVVGNDMKVDITFNSGEKGEFTVTGLVIAQDSQKDLAVIKVKSDKVPVPLDILKVENSLKPQMPIYAFGYPLGKFFADAPNKNPAVTVTEGKIKKLHRKNEILSDIQFNADINPGNSGGPVVNQQGQLIAIASRGIKGTQIEFGVPASRLWEFVTGSIKNIYFKVGLRRQGRTRIYAVASFNDPLNRITSIRLIIVPQKYIKKEAIKPVPGTGFYQPIVKNYQAYGILKYNSGKYRNSYDLNVPDNQDLACYFQFAIVKTNNQKFFTKPREYYLMSREKAATQNSKNKFKSYSAVQNSYIHSGTKYYELLSHLCGSTPMLMSADGKFLFTNSKNVIYKISTSNLEVKKQYSIGVSSGKIALSKHGLLVPVWNNKKSGIIILDENSLDKKGWISLPRKTSFYLLSNPNLQTAYAVYNDGCNVYIVDLKTKTTTKDINIYKTLKIYHLKHPAISPEGKFLYSVYSNYVYKFRITDSGLKPAGKWPTTFPDRHCTIVVSPDGKYVAICSKKANIYNNGNLADKILGLPVSSTNQNGFIFDQQRKRYYWGNKVFSYSGVYIKKLPKIKWTSSMSFNGRDKLFIQENQKIICFDLDYKPAKTLVQKDDSDKDWLVSDDKAMENISVAKNLLQNKGIKISEINIPKLMETDSICWSRDGKSFYALSSDNTIRKISYPELIVQKHISFFSKTIGVALCKSGVLTLPAEPAIYLLDENDLSLIKKIGAPEICNFTATPTRDIVYSSQNRNLYIIDINRGGIVKCLEKFMNKGKLENFSLASYVVSKDGKYLLGNISYSGPLVRFKISPNGLNFKLEESSEQAFGDKYRYSIESESIYCHQTSFTKKILFPLEVYKFDNLNRAILKTDYKTIEMDPKKQIYYTFDDKHYLNLLNMKGKRLRIINTGIKPDNHYKMLVHPDGGKFLLVSHDKIFSVEMSDLLLSKNNKQNIPEEVAEILVTPKTVITNLKKVDGIEKTKIVFPFKVNNSQICCASDKKHFFFLDIKGCLKKISASTFQEIKSLDFNEEANSLQHSREGLVVALPQSRQLVIIDEKTLAVKFKIHISPFDNIICSKNSKVAFSYKNKDKWKLTVIDLEQRKSNGIIDLEVLIKNKSNAKEEFVIPGEMTPDGNYFYIASQKNLFRFTVTPHGLTLSGKFGGFDKNHISDFKLSNGGKFIILGFGGSRSRNPQSNKTLLFKTSNLSRPYKKLLESYCPYYIDDKLQTMYSPYGVYDLNTGLNLIRQNNLNKIYPIPGKKRFISVRKESYSKKREEACFVRWGLPEIDMPKAVFTNKKITCVAKTENGVTRKYLKLQNGYNDIVNCIWEPGTNNIIIAWTNGKISKIDVEKMIEICSLDLSPRKIKIGNVAMSKSRLIVTLRYSKKVLIFSPKDLSFRKRLKFNCDEVFASPKLDFIILSKRNNLMIYDFNNKAIVDKWDNDNVFNYIVKISPNGKTIYIKDNTFLMIYSIENKRFRFVKKLKLPSAFRSANRINISNDCKYFALLPQDNSNSKQPYKTYIYEPDKFKKVIDSINTNSSIYTIGFDTIAGLWYYSIPDKYGNRLMIKRGKNIFKSCKISNARNISIHPKGGNLVMYWGNDLYWLKLDLSHKNFIKKGK